MQQKDFDSIFQLFKGTKAIIFDLRGYPRFDGNPFKNLLQKPDALMAKFREMKPSSPNIETEANSEMTKTETTQSNFQRSVFWAPPGSAVYPGKIVVLLNESNQSAGEHTCLVLKAICNATLIGSPTSGTNGVIAEFDIPGNLVLWFSGLEVSFPDGTRTQRVGIQPDITVYSTIKGIQSGKDEVLDRAIKYLQTGK
jgi:C-terminal processing protease CtpA/Prc